MYNQIKKRYTHHLTQGNERPYFVKLSLMYNPFSTFQMQVGEDSWKRRSVVTRENIL